MQPRTISISNAVNNGCFFFLRHGMIRARKYALNLKHIRHF